MVGAFAWLEDVGEPSHQVPEAADGLLADFADYGLGLGDGLFDRIEVRAVGREEGKGGLGRFDLLLHGYSYLAQGVVRDYEVTGAKLGHQSLIQNYPL